MNVLGPFALAGFLGALLLPEERLPIASVSFVTFVSFVRAERVSSVHEEAA